MCSASSRDGAMRRNAKIEYEFTLASRCVATSIDATAKAMQRNALRSVISQTFRGAGISVARVRWTARYARASAWGSRFV